MAATKVVSKFKVDVPVSNPDLLDREAAAAWIGVSERTLWSMTRAGRVPVVRGGKRHLYRREDLNSYLETASRIRK